MISDDFAVTIPWVPKMDADDYDLFPVWKVMFTNLVRSVDNEEMLKVLTGERLPPEDIHTSVMKTQTGKATATGTLPQAEVSQEAMQAYTAELRTYNSYARQLLTLLYRALPPKVLMRTSMCQNAPQLWQTLNMMYDIQHIRYLLRDAYEEVRRIALESRAKQHRSGKKRRGRA